MLKILCYQRQVNCHRLIKESWILIVFDTGYLFVYLYGDFCSAVSLMSTSTPSTAKEFQGQEFNTVWQATLRRYDLITLPFNYTVYRYYNILLVTQWQWLMHFFETEQSFNGLIFPCSFSESIQWIFWHGYLHDIFHSGLYHLFYPTLKGRWLLYFSN